MASNGSYSYVQTKAADIVWVVVPVRMDRGSVFGTDEIGGPFADDGRVCAHQMLLESQPAEVLRLSLVHTLGVHSIMEIHTRAQVERRSKGWVRQKLTDASMVQPWRLTANPDGPTSSDRYRHMKLRSTEVRR